MKETRNVHLGNDNREDTMDTMTNARRAQVRAALGNPNSTEASGDFSDLVSTINRRYVSVSDHTRIVPGADDLMRPTAGGGVVRSTPVIADMTGHAIKGDDEDGLAPRDMRSERQIQFMNNLISWITEHDATIGATARSWTDGMTERGLWTPGRGGNASDWITRLRAKLTEVKATTRPVPSVSTQGGMGDVPSVPDGRYAVTDAGSEDIKFYRVKNGTGRWAGRVFIEAQASDEFHKIRNVVRIRAILAAINTMGMGQSMALYGQMIGSCGRCGRTLTDVDSRAYGIGPDCRSKL